jgi:hypothetical protein
VDGMAVRWQGAERGNLIQPGRQHVHHTGRWPLPRAQRRSRSPLGAAVDEFTGHMKTSARSCPHVPSRSSRTVLSACRSGPTIRGQFSVGVPPLWEAGEP